MSNVARASVGIPYARHQQDTATREWFVVCPVCGARVVLEARKDHESFSGAEYRAHFADQHPTT